MNEPVMATAVYVLPPVTCDCPPENCEPWCGTCVWTPCPARLAADARLSDLHRRLTS